MSRIIEDDAKAFGKALIPHANFVSIAKKKIDEKLYNYSTSKNKYIFLKAVHQTINDEFQKHKAKCTNPHCGWDRSYEAVDLVINQEIESILEHFTPGEYEKSNFSAQEKYDVSSKINEILEHLNNLGLGQEILFNEINNMKEHMNLDKKSWVQLLKGKLLEAAVSKVVEVSVLNTIYQTVTQSIQADQFVLPK